jgi:hypothetical protein
LGKNFYCGLFTYPAEICRRLAFAETLWIDKYNRRQNTIYFWGWFLTSSSRAISFKSETISLIRKSQRTIRAVIINIKKITKNIKKNISTIIIPFLFLWFTFINLKIDHYNIHTHCSFLVGGKNFIRITTSVICIQFYVINHRLRTCFTIGGFYKFTICRIGHRGYIWELYTLFPFPCLFSIFFSM